MTGCWAKWHVTAEYFVQNQSTITKIQLSLILTITGYIARAFTRAYIELIFKSSLHLSLK